jgi:hypothetical protein
VSDLERVARDLVASLTEAARLVDELTAAARRGRQHAAALDRAAARVPGLRRLAAMLNDASRACGSAAEGLDQAQRLGIGWARQVAGGGSGPAASTGGSGAAEKGGDLAARGIAADVIAEEPHHWVRERQHMSAEWGRVERSVPKLSADALAEARRVVARRAEAEPLITADLREITRGVPGELVGLDNRYKGEDRILDKVRERLATGGVTAAQAARGVPDALRYTHEIPDETYPQAIDRTVHGLWDRGYELIRWRNAWDGYNYKGINSQWRHPGTGQLFEVQFHTPTSFFVNGLTHALYERDRDPTTTMKEQHVIVGIVHKIVVQVPVPPGAAGLRYELGRGHRG